MDKTKVFIIAFWGALMSALGILAVPILLLVLCNLMDYVTGLAASKYRTQHINSYKSIQGITKKVCMWLLVAVGVIIDEIIKYAGATVGITLPFSFLVACIVAVWLICNEILSILENITDIGVVLPPFMAPLVKRLKTQIEDKVDLDKNESGNK